jgi:hypothetical protein
VALKVRELEVKMKGLEVLVRASEIFPLENEIFRGNEGVKAWETWGQYNR